MKKKMNDRYHMKHEGLYSDSRKFNERIKPT